ncbi:MAG TPA: hypothetical protein VHX88_13255 [Solirubrobacteraceae bacterium]|nr:hypothetical protein [Solirubrobacteraceae bacterium]
MAFPTASRPQAWASSAALPLIATLLKLDPAWTDVEADRPRPFGHNGDHPPARSLDVSARKDYGVSSGRP